MNTLSTEIKVKIVAALEGSIDLQLLNYGFKRKKGSILYARDFKEATQKIELSFEIRPSDSPSSLAAIYPKLEVRITEINRIVHEMFTGNQLLSSNLSDVTLWQPIEFTSPKGIDARWYINQTEQLPNQLIEFVDFTSKWVIPFLDFYSTASAVCEAYDTNDERVSNVLDQKIRVVAAMILCERTKDAVDVMEKWFGNPGPRKKYHTVFEYLKKRAVSHEE